MEEVKEFKYLDYVSLLRTYYKGMEGRKRSSYGTGMGDREKKIWKGLRKKIEHLFDSLIWTVMGYGVEIWG